MKPISYANVHAQPEAIQPLGDYVLVRRLPDPADASALIVRAQVTEGKHVEPPRLGLVIAIGPGDKVTKCAPCKGKGRIDTGDAEYPTKLCIDCGGLGYPAGAHHPMHVAPGDTVLYWRAPSNNLLLDGDEFTFLSEEQHILAVLESDPATK